MTVAIKICGLTDKKQALEISKLGVNAIGFILYPPSPRFIELDLLQSITAELPPFVKGVGVFVNKPLDDLITLFNQSGLDLAQLHGEESPEYCQELGKQGVPWIKTIHLKSMEDLKKIEEYPGNSFLLDAWSSTEYGGTGKTIDWSLAREAALMANIILAGGITPFNVQEAIKEVKPYGVDVSSGVEVSPGIKSIEKVTNLLSQIK